MWRYLLALAVLLSFNDNTEPKYSENTEPYGVPTIVEYMNQLGYTMPETYIVTAYLAIDEYENRFHGITFSGAPAKPYHTVAVDPKIIPIGTWLYIEGLGWWKAEDTGNMIIGNRLDICVHTRPEAMQWGKQNRQVWVLPPIEDTGREIKTVMSDNSLVYDES